MQDSLASDEHCVRHGDNQSRSDVYFQSTKSVNYFSLKEICA